jgi:broad specificity phosphatase PhoE
MSASYSYSEEINLFVEGRISAEDALRQKRTANEVLHRFEQQPGVILADEVGMGKTFVALAVAVSVALSDSRRRPVVVMVPPSLQKKWPDDFQLFREKCLPSEIASRLQFAQAQRAVEFLKLVDDPPERRKSILFVTHGAMSRGLADGWVKLALIRRAMRWRRSPALHRALGRFLGDLLQMKWVERYDAGIWEELLKTPARDWLDLLRRRGVPDIDDDPVPQSVIDVFDHLDLDGLYQTLDAEVPRRLTANFDQHVKNARYWINEELRGSRDRTGVWKQCLRHLNVRLPLLILDEAHHLKNSQTRLASLFHTDEAQEDAEEISRGPLARAFERMLFLTATPFQLGHHELCSVLERFQGITWKKPAQPPMGCTGFTERLDELRRSLDQAQLAATALDDAWGRLRRDDLLINGTKCDSVESWWRDVPQTEEKSPVVRDVLKAYDRAKSALNEANVLLRPWVIRHLKPRQLPAARVQRRKRLVGDAILDPARDSSEGIAVEGESLLPFLLAARATACMPESRPVFAEGLASSYEAFLHTRRANMNRRQGDDETITTDLDDDESTVTDVTDAGQWYLNHLESLLPADGPDRMETHPKLSATIRRVVDIWRSGEKALVFCHYIATGRVLRQRISQAIEREIHQTVASKIGCSPDEAAKELERLGDRFFDVDSPLRRGCDAEIKSLLEEFGELQSSADALIDVVRRNLRTPSFLVRFFPIEQKTLTADAVSAALDQSDGSGLTLRELLRGFFHFLEQRCGKEDRQRYIEAMKAVQTGTHRGADAMQAYSSDELDGEQWQMLLPNVRLVNGAAKQETRQRLMLTFNTPFYPEVLIASSVMAEGVDLHMNCRYIIHHDLCWNPSTLEQRTGRVDRIGAKAERCGQPIHVFLPFVAETQDEKMYRVVMDRERWFSVVMGEQIRLDARTTDQLAERVPLPESLPEELRFRLEVETRG